MEKERCKLLVLLFKIDFACFVNSGDQVTWEANWNGVVSGIAHIITLSNHLFQNVDNLLSAVRSKWKSCVQELSRATRTSIVLLFLTNRDSPRGQPKQKEPSFLGNVLQQLVVHTLLFIHYYKPFILKSLYPKNLQSLQWRKQTHLPTHW